MPLALNFHKTFVPERRLIAALLEYSAQEKSGTYAEIASETGIPMGRYTGKVPAILDYARGMGLIKLESGGSNSVRKPRLTDFGRIVFLEDRLLGEPLTQWIAHMQLCRHDIGAVAWYRVFAEGRAVLGSSFEPEQLEIYLTNIFGPGQNRTGPLLRTYLDDAALRRAMILSQEDAMIRRNRAPLLDEYARGYAAFTLTLLETSFDGRLQVSISDLNNQTCWFDVCLWGTGEIARALSLMEGTGLLSVDRQMQPWIVERRSDAGPAWASVYDDLT